MFRYVQLCFSRFRDDPVCLVVFELPCAVAQSIPLGCGTGSRLFIYASEPGMCQFDVCVVL